MIPSRRLLVASVVAALGAPVAGAQQVTAITGATIIDGRGGPPIDRGTIIIRGDRIAAVGREGEVSIPRGAVVRRLTGRYLVPGFIDMHAHLAFGPVLRDPATPGTMRMPYDDEASREMARTALAFGITTARNPGGPAVESVALRDAIRLGTALGPRLYTAGEVIDRSVAPGLTTSVKTDAEVRAEVARQAALGVDYVKLYISLGPELLAAGIDEAHRRGLKALGHLFTTSWTEAARLRIDGIVHIVPGSAALLPESRRAEFLRSIRGTQFMLEWFEHVEFESAEFKAMVEALVENRVTIDPTLVVFEAMARGDDSAVTRHPDLRYAPPVLLENWRTAFTLDQGWKPEDYQRARRVWPRVLEMTKRLADAGVLLTVGTDVPNPWIPPGSSFHRELELFRDAGFSNQAILEMATVHGARALGIATDVGSLVAGQRADLLVLRGNPLADIRNTRTIEAVIQGGRWHSPSQLLPRRLREIPGR